MKNLFLFLSIAFALASCGGTKNAEKDHDSKKLFSSKNRKPWKTKDEHFSGSRKRVGGNAPVQYRGKSGPKTGGGNDDGFSASKRSSGHNTNGDYFRSKSKRSGSSADGDSFTKRSRRKSKGGDPTGDSFVSAKKKKKGR